MHGFSMNLRSYDDCCYDRCPPRRCCSPYPYYRYDFPDYWYPPRYYDYPFYPRYY